MSSEGIASQTHERYDWLDQSRGLVSLMFIFAIITYPVSGDPILGIDPLGPTFLNHGYKYFKGPVPLITIIDVGQQIFMFVMGFAAYLAFTSRWSKKGGRTAGLYAARRVGLLLLLSFAEACFEFPGRHEIRWNEVLWEGTLAKLAIGSFAAFSCIALIRDANRRFLFALGVTGLHAVLYASPWFDHYGYVNDSPWRPMFPFGAVNLAVVAVIATCFAQWVWTHPEGAAAAFRQRIAPTCFYALGAAYCLGWVQPAHHHDVTAALALFAVGISGLMLTMCFGFGQMGIRFPLLTPLGKNLLLTFVLGAIVVDLYIGLYDREFLAQRPFLTLLLVGILPAAILASVAVYFERKNIILRA
ncbi:MAG: hypothetical protein IT364_23380 [Candidatus Hydrogenedentes bacterium]|nr:hypothetical protein [Candidatus Hydrogenedentota bacterium]